MNYGTWSPEVLLADWKGYINRSEKGHKQVITTLQSFAGDAELLHAALSYARSRGVDVMVAAESDGTFF
jgi:hypothetical protein